MSETPIHNLLTLKETAEYLRIPLPTVYYLVQRGKIPAIQIGGRWRIKKSTLDRDILRQDKQGQPTVLVVDDDLGLQDLFRTFLKKIGFSRVVLGTAKEAINNVETSGGVVTWPLTIKRTPLLETQGKSQRGRHSTLMVGYVSVRLVELIKSASHSVLSLQPFRCCGIWTKPR